MSSPSGGPLQPIPKPARAAVGLASGAVLLLAIGAAGVSIALSRPPNWVQLGFAPIMALSGVLGILFARGHFSWSPGMTVASVAGPVAMGSILTYVACLGRIDIAGREAGYSLKPWLGANLGAVALIGAVGVYTCVWRHREARAFLLRALVALIPLAAGLLGAAYAWSQQSRGGEDAGAMEATRTLPSWASLGLLLGCTLLAGIAGCACGHYVIRAFEVGTGSDTDPGSAPGVTPPTGARSS